MAKHPTRRWRSATLGVGVCLLSSLGSAWADEPAPSLGVNVFTYSFNLAATSQYMYRGFSQTGGDPTLQGGADVAYGLLYAGAWASGIRYEEFIGADTIEHSGTEWYLYGGVRPTWDHVTFDLGGIYYTYPGGEYFEAKAGASSRFTEALSAGVLVYWSPDYIADSGSVWTIEGSTGYVLPLVGVFTPSVTGQLGFQTGGDDAWKVDFANGDDSYLYWNAGLVLAVGAISFDFRYWDTNVSDAGGFCTGPFFQCDAQFVFTTKVVLP
jgi:uncharacterized protein (TIGR02001 family)